MHGEVDGISWRSMALFSDTSKAMAAFGVNPRRCRKEEPMVGMIRR
jgi:hypothetical protein